MIAHSAGHYRALLMAAILLVTGTFVAGFGSPTPNSGQGAIQTITYCAAFPLDFKGGQSEHPSALEYETGFVAKGAQARQAFPLGLVNGTNWTSGPWTCYGYMVSYVGTGLKIGQIGIKVKTFDCTPAEGVYAIDLLDRAGNVTATENLSSSDWGSTSEVAPAVGDALVISAQRPLTEDELVLNSSLGQEAFRIAGSGPWEGCNY